MKSSSIRSRTEAAGSKSLASQSGRRASRHTRSWPLLLIPLLILQGSIACLLAADVPVKAEVKNLTLSGGVQEGKATLVIEALLQGLSHDEQPLIHSTSIEQGVRLTPTKLIHEFQVAFVILQGQPKEIPLALGGDGEIRSVRGEGLLDWSIRWGTNQTRYLVLRFPKTDTPARQLRCAVTAETEVKALPVNIALLTLVPETPALFGGYLAVGTDPAVSVELAKTTGLAPINADFLPEPLRKSLPSVGPKPLAYRFHGTPYQAALEARPSDPDPEKRQVVLYNFQLTGNLGPDSATFTLTADARVRNPEGGEVTLLSGGLALTEFERNPNWDLRLDNGRYVLKCVKPGEFPIRLTFHAAVKASDEWNAMQFQVAPSTLQPLRLRGLPADTEFLFEGAANPERNGEDFLTHLPASGLVQFAWKSTREEAKGRLFYAAEMLSQLTVSPGLLSQVALMEMKVMQGEMDRVTIRLQGDGEVTRVQGDQVLSWQVESVAGTKDRHLIVQLNALQKDAFLLAVETQTPLGPFSPSRPGRSPATGGRHPLRRVSSHPQ